MRAVENSLRSCLDIVENLGRIFSFLEIKMSLLCSPGLPPAQQAEISLGIVLSQRFYSFKSNFLAPEIVEKNALQLVVAAEQASQEVTEEDDEEEEEVDDDEEVS